jgi:hypothetical protein
MIFWVDRNHGRQSEGGRCVPRFDRKSGRCINAELIILAYFLEEARRFRKLNQRVFATRQERLHQKITSEIVSGLGSCVSHEANYKLAKKSD